MIESENRLRILSVGIDIGTSTTCLIFSYLTMENVAPYPHTPVVKIIDKEVFYRSAIYITPLKSDTELDIDEITKIISNEYKMANISPSDVQTGAVIITGDTARKSNADKVLQNISDYAGDFVVATAGPDLESILSGKGSGAAQHSSESMETVINFDVGGGTTNISSFYDGQPTDVDCLDVGGRLIRFSRNSMRIEYIFPKISELAKEEGIDARVGTILTEQQISVITDSMAEAMLEKLVPAPSNPLYYKLQTEKERQRTNGDHRNDVISFSGGVGDLVYMDSLPDNLIYGDIGVFLARSIRKAIESKSLNVIKPSETIGATVIGAGNHSVDVSGATVTISNPDVLPLINISILRITDVSDLTKQEFSERVQTQFKWLQGLDEDQNIALNVEWGKKLDYASVQTLADYIVDGMQIVMKKHDVVIVVTLADYGKVLGHAIQARLPKDKDVVCIDGIDLESGDYIDIGKPLGLGDAVPIVIKTIAFNY